MSEAVDGTEDPDKRVRSDFQQTELCCFLTSLPRFAIETALPDLFHNT